jgi:hypothetical protein
MTPQAGNDARQEVNQDHRHAKEDYVQPLHGRDVSVLIAALQVTGLTKVRAPT